MASPWLLFEAGAIAKTLAEARVCPYLIGLRESDIPKNHPLTQFQTKPADEEGTLKLMLALNAVLPGPLSVEMVRQLFGKFWQELESQLRAVPSRPSKKRQARSGDEILEEVLSLVRDLHRRPLQLTEEERRRERVRDLLDPPPLPIRDPYEQFIEDTLSVIGQENGIIWIRPSKSELQNLDRGQWIWRIHDDGKIVISRWLDGQEVIDGMEPDGTTGKWGSETATELRLAVSRLMDLSDAR